MSRKKSSGNDHRPGMTRREFSRAVTLAAATAAVVPVKAVGRTPEPVPLSDSGVQSTKAANASPVVEGQYQALLGQYGSRLSEEQKTDAKRLLVQAEKASQGMAKFALDNTNEPAPIFKVYLTEAE